MSPDAAPLGHHVSGSGEEVVYLNGGMMTWAGWAPVAERLGIGFRGVFFDFRGQLRSPGRARGGLEQHVRDTVALLDTLGVTRAHFLGTSFGAEVGLLLAARHPERVTSLAAVTATDVASPSLIRKMGELRQTVCDVLAGGDRTAYLSRLIRAVYSPSYRREKIPELRRAGEWVDALPREWFEGLLGILDAIEDLDLRPWLSEIRCPVLVVHAAADTLMPRERARTLAAALPRPEWLEHTHSGHALVVEDPLWLGDACRSFFLRHGARGESSGGARGKSGGAAPLPEDRA